jgi:hypothetical protein
VNIQEYILQEISPYSTQMEEPIISSYIKSPEPDPSPNITQIRQGPLSLSARKGNEMNGVQFSKHHGVYVKPRVSLSAFASPHFPFPHMSDPPQGPRRHRRDKEAPHIHWSDHPHTHTHKKKALALQKSVERSPLDCMGVYIESLGCDKAR